MLSNKLWKENSLSSPGIEILRKKFNGLKLEVRKAIKNEPEFTKRILKRHESFWSGEENSKSKLPLLYCEDPWTKWKQDTNWQRVLGNKGNSREFAIKLGCRVPELYWRGNNYYNIDFERLPEKYVIRPAIGTNSRMVFLIDGNLNLFDGKKYTPKEIISILSDASVGDPNFEFLFEEFLVDEKGEQRILDDYKFYMFNGEVACIRVINRQSPRKGTNRYYNENWELLPTIKNTKYTDGKYQPPPSFLEEMISFARTLSKACEIFIRVDLYATTKGAVFGEFATTPSHGQGYSRSGSRFLMKYWNKHCKGLI